MNKISGDRKKYYPLTHAQKRIYYDDRRYPGAPWANIGFIVKYREELDFNLLAQAMNEVVRKNDGFRLRLAEFDFVLEPSQYISPYQEFPVDEIDFSGPESERLMREWVNRTTKKVFHLIDSDLFYFACIKYNDEEYGYFIKIHHIITDGWSLFSLFTQVDKIYEALSSGESVGETPSYPSYIQYISDEQLYLESQQAQQDREFWNNTLLPLPKPVNLSTRKGDPANIQAGWLVLSFPEDLRTTMHEYCNAHRTSLYKLTLAALSVYVTGVTGLDDVVVGGANHGRSEDSHKKMMGMFVSTLLFRVAIDGGMSFDQLVEKTGNDTNYIVKNHQRYPFDLVAAELMDSSGGDVGFLRNITLNGHSDVQKKKFDYEYIFPGYEPGALLMHLNLLNRDKDGILEMIWIYQVEQFGESDIRTFHQGLLNVLTRVLADPRKKISEIELISPEEKKKILFDLNETKVDYPKDKTIHELFEAQADKTPDDTAVVFKEKELTYRELDEKSNRLARLLREKAVVPDQLVGIMVSRSFEMMVALLAVLKAGGAYVPIDPGYPIERIKFYMADSDAKILLTQQEIVSKFEDSGSRVEAIDIFDKTVYSRDHSRLENVANPHSLAYAIYTSGSTGKPKGVAIRHRNAVNFFKGMTDTIDFAPGKTIVALTTVSFDIFLLETLLPVTVGMKVVVANEAQQKDPGLLKDLLVSAGVNILQATPARLRLVLSSSSDFEALKDVDAVLVGGEPFPVDLFENLKEHYQGKIIDVYGPTETTVWSTVKDLTGEKEINIGAPIANTQVYIIDKYMRLQPVGVTGELYIGGDGVASGYLNRVEMTDERFIDNPFVEADDPERPYKKIYQTGDLARWLPNGEIECLGRIDHQVKIRGFRIETGEIENTIKNLEGINEAVVMARDDTSGEKFLCAYLVSDQPIDVPELESKLSESLLDYMIPSYFVQVDEIPLTPNQKVDRKALPDPHIKARGESYAAPRDEVEEKLAEIWAEVLQVEKNVVGIDDNFFKMGGHSLKAATMIAHIHKELNVKLLMHEVFEIPTIRKLGQHIKGAETESCSIIEKAAEKEYYPVTSAQKRLYILDLLEEKSITYNMPFLYSLAEKPIDDHLEQAFEKLIRRHECFRTSFEMVEKELAQKIHDDVSFKVESYDLKAISSDKGKSEYRLSKDIVFRRSIDDVMKRFVRPFDLSHPPMIRAGLLKTEDKQYFLMVDMHHIISDGESLKTFEKELVELYNSKESPQLKIQYKDYSDWLWRNRDIRKVEQKDQEAFWLKMFEGTIPVLNLPLDYQRPSVQSYEGSIEFFELDKEETEGLKKGSTLFMRLLAVFNILLAKLSGQDDIVVGTTVGGRSHPGLENLIGMFVKTLALRNFPSEGKTFADFSEELREGTLNAIENQDYPLEELIENLQVERDVSRNPLFDTMFTLQVMETSDDETGGLKIKPFKFRRAVSRFDMTFFAEESEDGTFIELEYCTKLFKEDTVRRFIVYFKNIISSVIKDPGMKIGEIEILSAEERRKILDEFNDSEANYPKDKTIHEVFVQCVEKTPENIALSFSGDTLSYREFNEKANQLARVLRGKGVEPNRLVGILADRSMEMMIGIYGVLKAGGAYLPMNPDYPTDRVRFLLKDTDARVLLTQGQFVHLAETLYFEGEVIDLEDEALYRGDSQNLNIVNTPNDLAYTIYTSGSTGMPKGVLIDHVSAVNVLSTLYDKYPLVESDVYMLKTSFMFDVSVSEIFGWFWGGGRLAILEPGTEKDPHGIVDAIEKDNVTHINFVPSMYNLFVNILDNKNISKLSGLKYIFLAGEAIWPDSIIKFRYLDSRVIIENIYGPTEATIYASRYSLANWERRGSIPIGVPIDNLKLFIVSTNQDTAPVIKGVGIPGELCVSGIQLARGYLNRPEFTAEKFVHNPFAEAEGWDTSFSKLYRTGDLCRWMPDGNIEYMGRIDFQVKVRGFRIELGEIEARLSELEEIKEAVVMAREDHEGEKYLCAYIIAEKGDIDTAKIESQLSEGLPDYMIPSYFIQLEKMPLNPSGKADRKSLPAPEIKEKAVDYAAPRDEIDGILVEIWSQMLHIEADLISIDDNFFKIGGHSLKAAVMIAVIHKKLEVKIAMHEIFELLTIRKLSDYIKGAQKEEYQGIEKVPEKEYYLQTSAQKRLYFMDQLETDSVLYNLQLMDVYCKGIDKEGLEEAFTQLIKRHESLRTSFHTVEGEAVQKVHDYEEVVREFGIEYYETDENGMIYSDQEGKEWTKVTGLPFQEVVEHFVRPFDLSKPLLMRVGLVKIYGNTRILMVDMHHIISDGVSLVVMVKDLWGLYEGDELPELKVQYKDYAEWLASDVQQAKVKMQETFWLETFSGEVPVLTLPYDFPRPEKMTFEGNMLHFEIEEQETRRLNIMAQEQGETLYMVLLAVYYVLLAKLSGQEEIVVGTVSAGRGHADLHPLIGMFVDTLALLNYPQSDKTFKEFLGEVKEATLKAFDNQDYPFEELVSKVAQRDDTSRNPMFDVVFGLENEAERSEEYLLEVLMLDKTNPYSTNRAKFDLMLMGAEKGDGLQFNIEYNTRLFKEETVERFIVYFKKIVSSVSVDIWQKISGIDIMPDDERAVILYLFNDTESEYPRDKTIAELFEEQVEKTPDNTAVVFHQPETGNRDVIDYRNLNRKANQMANHLQTKGVVSGSIVGMLARKSVEMMIGIVATLKAGGAYLPLNPDYPDERKKYIMDDCDTQILLTNYKEPITFASEVIGLDNVEIYEGDETFARDYSNDKMAYIMYTSGSTGKPKGVIVEQKNVVRLVKNTNFLDFTEEHRILQTGALEFDASTFEIWGALLNGSSLYLVDKSAILNTSNLKTVIQENQITTMWMTSALFNQMLDADADIFNGHKYLLTGGDIVSPVHVERLKNHVKGITVINGYGPTENTTFSTTFPIDRTYDKLPIGTPIANSTVYILNEAFNPVPVGVPGELFVGGDGVSMGYLNNPEMTHDKFFPDSFMPSMKEEGRLYATGDIARWLSDGTIEFMGRRDHQVKIRGFRIELGEIETKILSQKDIKDVTVIAREDVPGIKYLCAYFASEMEIDISVLREGLNATLPDYMMPSYFIQLDKIPLTSNGKVNRKLLPVPEVDESSEEYVAPTNETEVLLAEIWSEVLGIAKVGIDDNFFDLGGDSIKTILISSRLQKRQLNVSINDFFLNPTIREVAKHIKTIERKIDQGLVTGAVELVPIQQWFFEREFIEKHHFHHVMKMSSRDRLSEEIVREVFGKIVEHHDALRMIYEIDEKTNTVTQRNRGLDEGKPFDLEVIELREKADFETELAKEEDKIKRSVDLKTGPLVRLGLFRTDKGDSLLIVIHHAVVDGISWRVMMEDFETGCRQVENNEPAKFQDKTDSFQYWAAKLKEYADSPEALDELEYWKTVESLELEPLPRDHEAAKENKKYKNQEMVSMALNEEETDKLLKDVNWVYNTEINDILLTALGMAVNNWSGNERVAVNLEGHGREGIIEDIDISRTVGWFTSMYPVVFDMVPSNEHEFGTRIRQVKETLRRIPHKGVGYGILKYLTSPDKKGDATFKLHPEISFNYHGKLEGGADDSKKKFQWNLGDSLSPEFGSDHAMDIIGIVESDGLKLFIRYNKYEYDKSSIGKFADLYKANLLKIINHCVEEKQKIQKLGVSSMEFHIQKDYETYLEQIKQEQWPDLTAKNDYKNILLTGSTGFLGAHMLYEFLKTTGATLYLPVRGATQEAARDRLKNKLEFYFGDGFFDTHNKRFVVMRADLGEELLGLDKARYDELCEKIDAIVHPAANVKHHGLYEELHKDNVIATENLLELAETRKRKDFHYISTLDVCAGDVPGKEYLFFTEYSHDEGQKTDQIYLKSKLAAEKRVLAYREKGINGSIYRVGNLIFNTENGKFQENIGDDYFYSIIKGAVKLEMLTDNMKGIVFDMSFIDYSAKATVLLVTSKNLKNETHHVLNPNKLPMIEMREYLEALGVNFNDVKQDEAEDYLSKFEGNAEYEKIIQLLKLHSWVFEAKPGTQPVAKIDRTVKLLKRLGLEWPKTNKQLTEKMISHCKDVGFL